MEIQTSLRNVLTIERDAVGALLGRLNGECEQAVRLLHACAGRVVVTGVGKAGLIGQKLAATLSSTGTPALFLHAADAVHGDLGVLGKDDVVVAISNSGESAEIVELLPHLNALGLPIIAMTGARSSTLARQSTVVVDVGVDREADPLHLAPTASTTAALAMGDALAGAVMTLKKFTREKYAQNHPGGSLGRLLLSRVRDLMVPAERTPKVTAGVTIRDAISEMTSKRLGSTFVVDEYDRLIGIVTDGDLRRLLEEHANPLELPVADVMTRDPKRVGPNILAVESMRLMEDHAITVLPVVDGENRPISAIHMHTLVKAGLAMWSDAEE